MNPDLKEVFVPSKGTRNPRFWAQIAAMYAFRVLSENAYTTAQFAMYSVYTSVYTRIRIMYGSVLNKPTPACKLRVACQAAFSIKLRRKLEQVQCAYAMVLDFAETTRTAGLGLADDDKATSQAQ